MREWKLGLRFAKFRNLCMVVTAVLVFGFYFIYDALFGNQSWWEPRRMGFCFLVIGAVFVTAVCLFLNRMGRSMAYRLSEEALEVSLWGRTARYPFRDFRKACYRLWGPFDTIPVVFELSDGRKLELNQYLGDLGSLTLELLIRIQPYAEPEEGLLERIRAIAERP